MMARDGVVEWGEGAFCKSCGELRVECTRMIYKLEVFCGNGLCDDFCRTIWVDRATYFFEASE